ncbi:MAG: hypothetical protein PUJ60_05750 [bacterium]|nr:hypothetical protein [bacterium]MDO4395124.1 hypothetical protein [Mycoplasmatota bacterium]MDY4109225.1 hypothetical protein [Bacilli bacterium]
MLDYINYFYNLYPPLLNKENDNYVFFVGNEKYYLTPYRRELSEIKDLVELNKRMISSNSLVHEIIINKFNEPISVISNENYVLLRVYVNDIKKIDINDIIYMLNENVDLSGLKSLLRTNWVSLWSSKVDYIEYQMGHLIKKYPFLNNTIDYYLGLCENAITYIKNLKMFSDYKIPIGISHKRIIKDATLFDLYNPLNLIIDYKVRNIAEYLKDAFFKDEDVNYILNIVFKNFWFDKLNLSLLVARLLYPSYYFDLFEEIIDKELDENIIFPLTKKSSKYEEFIDLIIKNCNLQNLQWLSR